MKIIISKIPLHATVGLQVPSSLHLLILLPTNRYPLLHLQIALVPSGKLPWTFVPKVKSKSPFSGGCGSEHAAKIDNHHTLQKSSRVEIDEFGAMLSSYSTGGPYTCSACTAYTCCIRRHFRGCTVGALNWGWKLITQLCPTGPLAGSKDGCMVCTIRFKYGFKHMPI